MSNVISIAAVRADRVKRSLADHGQRGEFTLIETKTGLISAKTVVCRERFAEILNVFGDYSVVDYAEIRSVRPVAVAQHSVINAHGDFVPAHEPARAPTPVAVLPFTPRRKQG